MAEKYSLPRKEEIVRPLPEEGESWVAFLTQRLTGKKRLDLKRAFTVTQDPELGYRRFVQGEGGEVDFELLLSDEAAQILNSSGKVRTKKEVKDEIARINQDRFGPSSIDLGIKQPGFERLKNRRSVNAFGAELEKKLGIPIAIKGSEKLGKEDFRAQFIFIKQREKEWQNMPEYIKEILHICKVYAAIRYKISDKGKYPEYRDLLIMERVSNAKAVEDNYLGPWLGSRAFGFGVDIDPLLAEIIRMELGGLLSRFSHDTGRECYSWHTLQEALEHAGLQTSDIMGRNVLYSAEANPQKRHYVIIDQGGR